MHDSEKKMIILERVGSTNNYAMGLIKSGKAAHGISVFAYDQSEGKGRMGRQWISEPLSNVHLSIITQMQGISVQHQFQLSMIAALSSAHLLEQSGLSQVFVKWPNDIIVNDRKAGGILIENVIRGTLWQWSVTGIGLNVNQKFSEEERATSLSNETGNRYNVLDLAKNLYSIFMQAVEKWLHHDDAALVDAFNAKLYKKDEKVKVQVGNRVFETRIKGVSADGKLITMDTFRNEWDLDAIKILY